MIKKKILAVWRGERIPQSTKDFTNDQNGAPDAAQKNGVPPTCASARLSRTRAGSTSTTVPTTRAPLQQLSDITETLY